MTDLKKIVQKGLRQLSAIARKAARQLDEPEKKAYARRVADWYAQDKNTRFRTNYPELTPRSIVLDLGGYEGQWASDIYAEHLCEIHVFEPLPDYAAAIERRFRNNEAVKVYAYGLGARDEQLEFAVAGDSTSVFGEGTNKVAVDIKNIDAFLAGQHIDVIDLLKINIEGGEYELLEHLLDQGLVRRINNLQIQFHNFVPNAEVRMKNIQDRLAETHATTYLYPFFWENWRLLK
ncbi:FkbM family methyltransferase [Lewinellaceae bacterium SD302]|nr:FkbM family methyltransferase [Lewinellaceae bacterium SD302]